MKIVYTTDFEQTSFSYKSAQTETAQYPSDFSYKLLCSAPS